MRSGLSATLVRQRGNMLIMALFAMVILSLIGVSMAQMVTTSEKTVVYEVLGARAEQASRIGLEILAHAIKPVNGPLYLCESSFTLNNRLYNMEGFEGCTVVVRCSTRSFPVGGSRDYHYELKSTGTCAAGDVVGVKTNTFSMTKRL